MKITRCGHRIFCVITNQNWLVMKLTTFFILAAFLQVRANGYSQKISLHAKNEPLVKVLEAIKKKSGYVFFYKNADMVAAKPVNLDLTDATLEETLIKVFENQPFQYYIQATTVFISPQRIQATPPASMPLPGPPAAVDIHGNVTDNKGVPLQGVSVMNRKTKKGTTTDKEGNFTISASANDMIYFSFIGHKSTEKKITSTDQALSVVMDIVVSSLDEMVIIGYGAAQRKDLTGSVSTVAAKDIQNTPFLTVDNALAGKAPGVQITKTDGTPGGAVRIRVRGSTSLLGGNDPLYVIDGVPLQVQTNYINSGFDVVTPSYATLAGGGGDPSAGGVGLSTAFVNGLNSLGSLNIDDIESITIMKDASSTAIYGSKAANGVVIITTKKGKKDMKPQVMFSYYNTLTQISRKPKLLNADQYKMLITEAASNSNAAHDLQGRAHYAQTDQIVNDPSGFFGKANTDWISLVTRSTLSHNADIALQGGGNASRYYSSISFNNTPGVVIGTGAQRVSGKINLENEINAHFKFITNFNIGYTNQDISGSAYDQALSARPDYSPYDSAGNYTSFQNVNSSYQIFQNPLALTTGFRNSKMTRLMGSLTAVYDLNSALQFKSTVSLNNQTYNQRVYSPSYVQILSYVGNVPGNSGVGSNANSRFADWFVENTLGYKQQWKEKHTVDFLAGTSYETQKTSFFSAAAAGYPNDNVLNNLSSAITPLSVTGNDPSKPQSYLLSFYLRANYAYMDKYLLTFTGRSDGSSKFGPNNKFGYFPSGAMAWRLSKEDLLKNVTWIDDIKVRGSYGLTGTQNIGDQMYRSLYSPYSYSGNNALAPTQLGNPKIKWETTKQTDIGLDWSFFKSRLQGTFDYYRKQTDNALLSLPVPLSSSYTSLLSNVVGIRNTGLELSLQGDVIRTKNFRWYASFNITWPRSLVTRLSSKADQTQIGNLTGLEIGNTAIVQGKPLGLITGVQVTGIIKTQKELDDFKSRLGRSAGIFFRYLGIGDPMYTLDSTTYTNLTVPAFPTVIGSGAPRSYGGFTQGLSYKNFDLTLYFTFSQGGHLMWGSHLAATAFQGSSNANAVILDRYTPTNTNTNHPRLLWGSDNSYLYGNNTDIFSSSYVKLRTVTFNYRLGKSRWIKNAGIQSAAVFASVTNVFTITRYPGIDPETSDDAYSVAGGYFDPSNYPATRSFSLGLKVGF
jgi:TonB-linked SusC/RagA family outer membrane protein